MEHREDMKKKPNRSPVEQYPSLRRATFQNPVQGRVLRVSRLEEGKKRSVEQIDAAINDWLSSKSRRRLANVHRSEQSTFKSPNASSPSAMIPGLPLKAGDGISSHPSLVRQHASRELGTIALCEEGVEEKSLGLMLPAEGTEPQSREDSEPGGFALDGTRFEKSIKGLFNNARLLSTRSEIVEAPVLPMLEQKVSLNFSPPTSPALPGRSTSNVSIQTTPPTPPRVYTPLALPLSPTFVEASPPSQADEEVRRLEADLLRARRSLEKDVASTYSARKNIVERQISR